MNKRATLERCFYKRNRLFNTQIVGSESSDEEAMGRSGFKNEIRCAIVVDELSNISALLIERPKALEVPVVTVNAVAYSHSHAGRLVACIVEMSVKNESPSARVVKDLRSLKNPIRAKMVGICKRYNLPAKSPMHEIFRGIA